MATATSSPDLPGRLVAFEGTEGAGKSSHILLVAAELEREGYRVHVTAEPGGTPLGRTLRQLLLKTDGRPPTQLAELFLYLADRTQHVTEMILPALRAGDVVLTDRFSASTIAYQGYGRGLDLKRVIDADAWARAGIEPDLNLLLDCPVRLGLSRARGSDRFHEEVEAFHERVREGFHAMAAAAPTRWSVVDATGELAAVNRAVMSAVRTVLPEP